MGKIIDISHHHKVDNWDRVRNSVDVLITKATEGQTFVDDYFKEVVRKCEEFKIPYWLYTYLRDGDETKQVDFLIKTCKNVVGEYFVGYVLDVEECNSANNIKKAMDRLAEQDCKMMLYTMYAHYDMYRHIISDRPNKCAWWEARYGLNNGEYNSKYPCHSGVDLHQYTSQGACPGIPDEIDLNRVTGNGKKIKWLQTPKNKKEVEAVGEKKEGCFAPIKSPETCTGIADFLHKRGYGAGEHNLSMIAAENYDDLRDALYQLAKKGKLRKPKGLNRWNPENKK